MSEPVQIFYLLQPISFLSSIIHFFSLIWKL